MYWPKDGIETYGVIQVKVVKEEVMATYTVRTFQIRHLKLKKKKQYPSEKFVYQYHYTNWPDHGTPDHPLPVLDFVRKSSAANPQDSGPIVVHCSAGVGRTGTYIVLDAMLKQIEHRKLLNIFGFLRHIRTQRNFLVQTEEQYIFLHDALVEAIASCETNLTLDQIAARGMDGEYLNDQFKLITSFTPKDIHMTSATKQVNQVKNRMIMPLEGSRAHLTPKPGMDGTDYINATWLFGFRRLRDFIITQHPLSNTIKDFWQMIMDHQVQTIVCLSTVDDVVSRKNVYMTSRSKLFFFSLSCNSGQTRMKQLRTNTIDCSYQQRVMTSSTITLSSTLGFSRFKKTRKLKYGCCTIRTGRIRTTRRACTTSW